MYEIEEFKLWRGGKLTTFRGLQTEKLSIAREAANRIFDDLGVVVEIREIDLFKEAMKAFPACIAGGLDRPKTVADLVYQALHELDMYNEGQDGAITSRQAKTVRNFIGKFRTTDMK